MEQGMNGKEDVEKRKRFTEEEEKEVMEEEEEEEEERIKKFFDLLGRIREMKEIFQKRGSPDTTATTREDVQPWKPSFKMEDFKFEGNNNKRRKIEERKTGIEQEEEESGGDNRSVRESLNLNLGL